MAEKEYKQSQKQSKAFSKSWQICKSLQSAVEQVKWRPGRSMASQKGPTPWGISTLYFYCYSCLCKAQLGTNSHLVPGVKTRGIWHKTAPKFHTRALHCSGLAPASPLNCHAVVLGLVSPQLSPDSTRQPFLCQAGEHDDRVMGSTSMLLALPSYTCCRFR